MQEEWRYGKSWFHTHEWQLRVWRDILAVEILSKDQGIPAPHQDS